MNQDQITAKMAEIQGESLNTAFALSTKAIERAQELADLNFSATKEVFVEAQDGLEQALTVKDPQAFVSYVQSDALAPLGNKLAAHQRAVAKIVAKGTDHRPCRVKASQMAIDEEAGAHLGRRVDQSHQPRVLEWHIAGVVMVGVKDLGTCVQQAL